MDLLLWLTGKTAKSVSSYGSTYLFKEEMAPKGSALRCMDGCSIKETCPFDAEKIYLTNEKTGVEKGNTDWPCNVLTPKGSALRCMDGCSIKETCPFDAEKIYLTNEKTGVEKGNTDWPCNVLTLNPTKTGVEKGNTDWPCNVLTLNPTSETVRKAIKEGPYGRCVYHCDNNVVDHQVVNICMTDGSTMSFTMSGFSEKNSRFTKFMGTKGEILADLSENTIQIQEFGKKRFTKFMGTKGEILADLSENTIQIQEFGKKTEIIDVSKLSEDFSGHAGGDNRMVEEFLDMLLDGKEPEKSMTTLERSLESHYIALAAEQSRLDGGNVVDMDKIRRQND